MTPLADSGIRLRVGSSTLNRAAEHRLNAVVVFLLALIATATVQAGAYLNHDVAWFAWGASEMLGGAVLGRDIIEPNFPLAYIIYVPAALLGAFIGLSAGVKLWMLMLIALSASMVSLRLERAAPLPVLSALGLFTALAFPKEFGQREQIAFFLVLPYCLPARAGRSHSIIVGAMAGIGFAIKPHFLLAWVVIEIGRKPLRAEQLALIATGAAYAVALLLLFQPFLSATVPITRQVYWAFDRSASVGDVLVATSLAAVMLSAGLQFASKTAVRMAQSALAFIVAAYAQQRLYGYQLLPAWSFIVLAAASLLAGRRPLARVAGVAALAGLAVYLAAHSVRWWDDSEQRRRTIPRLTESLEGRRNFAVLSVHPYPAFPTALYTDARYVGVSNSHWFLPAVGQSGGKHRVAVEQAVSQARRELLQRPEVVIVDRDWTRHTRTSRDWNGAEFVLEDAAVRRLWSPYRASQRIGNFDIYVWAGDDSAR